AVASAKEVVAAPVVAVEPVALVCPEPVVEWRPTGYIDFAAKYYGEEDRNLDQTTGKYIRTQLAGSINLTEKSKFEFRARNYANLRNEDYAFGNGSTGSNNLRTRYSYNHGLLGDSKINLTSRVEYYNRFAGTDTHNLEYQARLQFAPYFDFMPSWAQVSDFTLAPKVGYQKLGTADSDYDVNAGMNIYTYTNLPYGVGLELNMYNTYYSYGTAAQILSENGMEDNQFDIGFEAYLYKNFELYSAGKNKLELTTEFGYETYDMYESNALYIAADEAATVPDRKEGRSYQAYALTGLQLSHQYSKTLKVYAWAGGEFKNWATTGKSEASNWSWQPQVTVGFRSSF
ncbi:MAG: FomA family porin-like outer membrane protein, partial [Fusobacteriaceae bacterium]